MRELLEFCCSQLVESRIGQQLSAAAGATTFKSGGGFAGRSRKSSLVGVNVTSPTPAAGQSPAPVHGGPVSTPVQQQQQQQFTGGSSVPSSSTLDSTSLPATAVTNARGGGNRNTGDGAVMWMNSMFQAPSTPSNKSSVQEAAPGRVNGVEEGGSAHEVSLPLQPLSAAALGLTPEAAEFAGLGATAGPEAGDEQQSGGGLRPVRRTVSWNITQPLSGGGRGVQDDQHAEGIAGGRVLQAISSLDARGPGGGILKPPRETDSTPPSAWQTPRESMSTDEDSAFSGQGSTTLPAAGSIGRAEGTGASGELPYGVKRRPTALHVPEISLDDGAPAHTSWQETQPKQEQQQGEEGSELQDGESAEVGDDGATMSDAEISGEDSQESAGATDDEQPAEQRESSEEEELGLDVLGMIKGAVAQGLLRRKAGLQKLASNVGHATGGELQPCF